MYQSANDIRRGSAMETEEERAREACEPLLEEIKELEAKASNTDDKDALADIENRIQQLRNKIDGEWSFYRQMMDRD